MSARVTIMAHTVDGTTVEITEDAPSRPHDQKPADEVGALLDEAVRRTRAALELDGEGAR